MTLDDAEGLIAAFAEKAEPLGVVVRRAPAVDEAVHAVFDWIVALGDDQVVVAEQLAAEAPGLAEALHRRGLRTLPPSDLEELRDAPMGASLAVLAIAETGSTLLSEKTLGDRAVGMLCLSQLIICATPNLVPSLDDAAPVLRELAMAGAPMSTLVTGPSRTADIERVLTVGVQGPGRVCVVFVDDLQAMGPAATAGEG